MNDFQDLCAESNPGPGLEEGPAWQGAAAPGRLWPWGWGLGQRVRDRKGEGLLEAAEGRVSRDRGQMAACVGGVGGCRGWPVPSGAGGRGRALRAAPCGGLLRYPHP